MLHNITGRAKSGKTEYILSVCGKLIEEKKHTFLIVPEQSALIYERKIIERFGNRSNEYIEVINFKRLCNRVFRETGGLTQSYIDGARMLLLVYRAVKSVKEQLCEYGGAGENTVFIKKALDVIRELKMFGVTPEALEKTAAKLTDTDNSRLAGKLRDFSLIYSAYEGLITEVFGEGFSYRDSTDDLERLATVLCDTHFFKGKTVLIDSFYGFTVPEISIIDRMIRDAQDFYITYLFENGTENILFERGKKAYLKISTLAKDNFVEYEDIKTEYRYGFEDENLTSLEKSFAFELCNDSAEPSSFTGSGIELYRCENVYDEAKIACAVINKLVADGARYSDITVLSRNPEELYGILDTELRRNGIPFGFSVKYDLLTRPASSYIASAFEFSKNKSAQSVLRFIKTGLTCLDDTEADLTECYIKTWNIQGKMFTESQWMMNPDGYASSEEMSPRAKKTLETVHSAREKLITPLVVFDEEIRAAECANGISEAVVRLLESGRYAPENLSQEETVYHNMVMDALDCIADICGNLYVSPAEYAVIFEMILSEYDTGRIPGTVDEVTVANIELYRGVDNRYTILPGLNDGIFPKNPSADSIFSDRERILLKDAGLELSGTTADEAYDELFLAYKAVCSCTKGLYLLYSAKDTKGDVISQSCVVSMCKSAVQGLKEKEITDIQKLKLYLSDSSLMSELSSSNPEFSKAVEDYLSCKGIVPKSLNGSTENYLKKETADSVYGDDILLSPSRLEKFNNCACSYFGTYTLALSPEKKAVLGSAETGNIIHKILEILICELSEMKQSGKEITEEYALRREKEILDGYIAELVGDSTKKELSKRFKYLYGRLSGALDACVTAMTRELLESEFVPVDFEMSIGKGGADIPFESIPIFAPDGKNDGTLTIVGKIDRTDIYKKDGKVYIRVEDYKTGKKKFCIDDVNTGTNLQMLLYLYSLSKNGASRYDGLVPIPAGVLYTPIHRPSYNLELGEEPEADASREFHPNGLLIDDTEILRAMEKGLEGKFIPVKLNKDGSFNAYSSVTSSENMEKLLGCAAEVASKLAYEIKKGKIGKNPYRCDNLNSCNFCDLAPFCRYEPGEEGTRYSPTKYSDEVFELTAGGDK